MSITKKKTTYYQMTRHAILRARERVGIKGKGNELAINAHSWVNKAMETAIYTHTEDNENRHYKYNEFDIIINPMNIVVTVSYYKPFEKQLIREVYEMVELRIDKELRPLKKKYRETAILMHEAEIKKYKSYNPKSIESIQNEIDEYSRQLISLEHRIERISNIPQFYNLKEQLSPPAKGGE